MFTDRSAVWHTMEMEMTNASLQADLVIAACVAAVADSVATLNEHKKALADGDTWGDITTEQQNIASRHGNAVAKARADLDTLLPLLALARVAVRSGTSHISVDLETFKLVSEFF
jgi:hypothetical protein